MDLPMAAPVALLGLDTARTQGAACHYEGAQDKPYCVPPSFHPCIISGFDVSLECLVAVGAEEAGRQSRSHAG
jgi:hypothetical protein